MRVAYRFNDVRTNYQAGLLQKPLSARHRAFVNTGYKTTNGWAFDFTLNWQGEKRIPTTAANPEAYRLAEKSPAYYVANAQISKQWKRLDVYLGAENLFDYMQENPIIASSEPHSDYFDASLVWGPVLGRKIYAGIRLKIQ